MRCGIQIVWMCIVTALGVSLGNAEEPRQEPGFISIFNGKDLSGWQGRKDCWRVADGVIEGAPENGDETPNCWLTWRDSTLKNFHLKLRFRIHSGNSGVFYRAVAVGDAGRGYQAEVATGPIGTGKLHHGGGKRGAHAAVGQFLINQEGAKGLLVGEVADTKWLVRLPYYVTGEWTDYDIIVRGNHFAHYVNGVPTVEFIDRDEHDAERKRRVDEGILALQLHGGHAMQVHFKDIRLKQFSESFGDALLLFNGQNLDGWIVPQESNDCWRSGPSQAADEEKRKKSDTSSVLICDGSGKAPLTWGGKAPEIFVLRYQRLSGHDDPTEDTPLRSAAGWENVEVTVHGEDTRIEINGQYKTSGPVPLQDGKVALPSNEAAEYRNIVLIPF